MPLAIGPGGSLHEISPHTKGLIITTTGVLVLSPDSLLIRLVDASSWTIVFWRALLSSIGLAVFAALMSRRNAWGAFRSIGSAGLVVAVLFGAQLTLFVTSIANTNVANTLVVFATAPFFAAVFTRVFLREAVPRRVWISIGVATAAIALIFSSSLGSGRLLGDLAALGAAMALGAGLVVIRHSRQTNMMPAWSLGALLAAVAVIIPADPLSVDRGDFGILLLSGLIVLPVAFGLINIGPRYLPAPEAGLILLLETILGPVWVWVALGEQPTTAAVVGGFVVIGVLVINSLIALGYVGAARRRPPAPTSTDTVGDEAASRATP